MPRCDSIKESNSHALLGCVYVRCFWEKFPFVQLCLGIGGFDLLSAFLWVVNNLPNLLKFFAVALWTTWFYRNKSINDNIGASSSSLFYSYDWAIHYQKDFTKANSLSMT